MPRKSGSTVSNCAVWDATIDSSKVTFEALKEFLPTIAKKWVFQLECGDTGYLHYQMRFSLIKRRTLNPLLNLFESGIGHRPSHVRPTTVSECEKFRMKGEASYVMKADTRVEGPWKDSDPEKPFVPKHLSDLMKTLYPYQRSILDISKVSDHRHVNVVYSPEGNQGRSTLADLAELYHGYLDIPPLNDAKDIMQLLCNICMDAKIRDPKVIFFDLPRCMNQEKLHGMYNAIEQVKKGKLYDIRNHLRRWRIESPVVWVMTNTLPNFSWLSMDRWKLWIIDSDYQLVSMPIPNHQVEITPSFNDLSPRPDNPVKRPRGRPRKTVNLDANSIDQLI